MWDAPIALVRGKFRAVNTLKKKKGLKSITLSFNLGK